MDNLRILSLGRNLLKKIENVEVVADTLEELWLSYNQIEKLVRAHEHGLSAWAPLFEVDTRPACSTL
jgi:hypothetical protein